ncbi:OX-2 membrane glycoprotein-like [Coregonus clupeaformis]|uniref:OX-2 membrane glycoprotein-like n=1 Tax=Coregonus clupeaformis TaxID=59861 RepID=UPI001E1C4E89|nr:OX-2 membrane glycoprotein-like [Coregonus clupeaformis]
MKPKDVRQVTCQKVTPGAIENVATYSKRGPGVNPPFKGKVEFEDEGLQNCSIIIRGVSRGDEGCYKCLFNAFPDGPISGTTCLQVNGLYGPSILNTQTNNSHITLSCSATGRPAPIVTWEDSEILEHFTIANVTHPNGTVTVTITAVVAAFSLPDKDTMVRCVVSSGGAIKQRSMVIPARDQASFAGQSQVSDDDWISDAVAGSVVGLVCLIAVICVLVLLLKRINDASSRKAPASDPEISRTPTKTPTEWDTPTSSPPTRDTPTFTPSQMTTPTSSPFQMLHSLSSSAKRRMQQAQDVVEKISLERPDDLQCRRKLLEGYEN